MFQINATIWPIWSRLPQTVVVADYLTMHQRYLGYLASSSGDMVGRYDRLKKADAIGC